MPQKSNIQIFLQPPDEIEELDSSDNDREWKSKGVPDLVMVPQLRRSATEPDLAARVCVDRRVLTVEDCYGTNRKGSIKLREEKPEKEGSIGSRFIRSIKRNTNREPPGVGGLDQNGGGGLGPRRIGFQKAKKKTKVGPRVLKLITSLFPFLGWMREYQWRAWLASDLISGVTAAVFQVPQGLGNGLVANVPAVMGLYSSFFPTLVYSFLGTSRQTSIGTFTVLALMVGTSINKYTDPSMKGKHLGDMLLSPTTPSPWNIAISLSIISGLTQALFSMLRLGRLGVLISPPLAAGFTAGCAVQTLVPELPGMLGLNVTEPSGYFAIPKTFVLIAENIHETQVVSAGLSACAVVFLIIGKDFINPRVQKYTRVPIPFDLLVVIISVVISSSLNLHKYYGVPIVKEIPLGLPAPSFPPPSIITKVIIDGMVIGVVGFVVTYSMALNFGKKYNHKVDANQELLAMGASNFVGGIFCCIPACGSLARSAVLESVGCKTQLTGMVCSACMLAVLYFLGGYLEPLPTCVLAVSIGTAVKDYLLTVRQIFHLWQFSKPDSLVWALTFLATAILDVSTGLMIGVILALFTITWRMHSYRGVVLKEFQSSGIFVTHSKKRKLSLAATEKGKAAVFRFASPLCFATMGHFERDFSQLLELIKKNARQQRTVVVDCSAVCFVDSSGVQIIDEMIAKCRLNGMEMLLAAVPESVVATLDRSGTLRNLGYHNVFLSLQDATRSIRSPEENLLQVEAQGIPMQMTHM